MAVCTCPSLCTLGAKKCGGSVVQECLVLSNGCPGWNSATSCQLPQMCQESGIAATCSCPTSCAIGARQCGTAGGVQECITRNGCPSWGDEQACSVPNGTPKCAAGVCAVASCKSGYRDCVPTVSGCETAVTSDVENCGGCGQKCLPNSTCSTETCNTPIGYPVKDCAAGLGSYKDQMGGYSIVIPKGGTLKSFGIIPETDGTWNLVLYSDVGGQPGSLIAQTGDRPLVAYGGAFELAVPATPITAGTYWLMDLSHLETRPRICVSLTAGELRLWQTNEGVSGDPPAQFPAPSTSTYVSFQRPWNTFVVVQMPGG